MFPQLKPRLFRSTLGPLAFRVFSLRGKMQHPLDEAIPGETIQSPPSSVSEAQKALLMTLERFDSFQGPVHPHFAYGNLTKAQYARAHAMHIEDHWQEIAPA